MSWNQFAIIFGQLVVYFVNFLILGSHANPVIDLVNGVNQIMNPEAAAWTTENRLAFDVCQRGCSGGIIRIAGIAGS